MFNFIKKILDSPTLMSWSSVFVRFGSAIFVLPLILKFFSPVEQSFWFFINTIIGIANIADSGFGPTLIRAVSYFKAGALKIPRTREEYDEKMEISGEGPNLQNLRNLLKTSFRIYFFLNLFLLVVLSTVGVLLVWNIMNLGGHDPSLWISYAVIILFCVVSINTVKWSSFIRGLGFMTVDARFSTFIGFIQIIAFVIVLLIYPKPVLLVSVMFIQAIVRLLYLRRFVLRWFKEQGVEIDNKPHFDKKIFHSLWGATWRNAGLSWGSYAIITGTQIVVAQIKDPVIMASFLFTMRVIQIIGGLAQAPFYTNLPKIYEQAAVKNFEKMKKISSEYIFTGMALLVVAFTGMALLGDPILALIGVETRLLPLNILLIIFITEILNWHSAFHASIYISTNQIPFLIPTIISGALIIGLGFHFLPIYGVMGLVLTQFFVQLSCNNWFSVSLTLRLLKWNFFRYMVEMPGYGTKGILQKLKYFAGKAM